MSPIYTEINDFTQLVDEIVFMVKLKKEQGAKGGDAFLARVRQTLESLEAEAACLEVDTDLKMKEPDDLPSIRKLRPDGPRKMAFPWDDDVYREKVEGALLGRMAGCTLGTIVEGWAVQEMEDWGRENNHSFPPTDYWPVAKTPTAIRYMLNQCRQYTRDEMDGVPLDDDIIYTLLGVMTLEECGLNFTSEDIGRMWDKYLAWIYKDMEWPLKRYLADGYVGMAAENSPYSQLICASIRCDPYGYVSPGWPEIAATFGYRDAFMSHRRSGIYGSMFFSAAIAAAFCVDHPVKALEIGLTEIPKDCQFARDVQWALEIGNNIKNYREARAAVDVHFGETALNTVHISLNACLTILGLMIGGTDFTRLISETVAMGYDNDCTAATAGSIVGAIVSKRGIPAYWYKNFNNKVHSYIRGHRYFAISDIVDRYQRLAKKVISRY
jgi:ADP-ribosylglycohydrolase